MLLLTVRIRSRSGNVVLALLGATYAASAAYLLGWTLIDSWGAFTSSELRVVMLLAASIAAGAWFIAVALRNAWLARMLHRDDSPRRAVTAARA